MRNKRHPIGSMICTLAALLWTLALASPAAAAVMGDSLTAALEKAAPGDRLEVVVSFEGDGPLTPAQIAALRSTGVTGFHFQRLPIAGVLATPAQVEAMTGIDGLRSLWLNEPLEYENEQATQLTGVDRLQTDANLRRSTGLPTSGRGIGIMINDSGIDATHPDLDFTHKTVQNVYAGTNLNAQEPLLPIVWVENVPDSDIGSGHGTHVAATAAGTGAASGGRYAGVAVGADLIGYGSGAVLFILDTLGAFDYALVNQVRYNIRVISNSWGTPSDANTDFDPDDPINIATKQVADRGIVTVFSAGNSGSLEGTVTGNYKKAPWVVMVAAASKSSVLAAFSSRGDRGRGGTVSVGGETFQWVDRPTVTAPGVDIVSAMANTNVVANPVDLNYASASGTSMAAPHVAGIIALLLEANPTLDWRGVKRILTDTATNMSGYRAFEVGAGMVNAHAAVAAAAGARDDYGLVQNVNRTFNANILESPVAGPEFDLRFFNVETAVTGSDIVPFTVAPGLSTVIASANVPDNTVALVLTDPAGNRYASAISLPLLGPNIGVSAPAVPGEWTIEVRGIGSVSGVALDPLGLTNGTALPATIHTRVSFIKVDGFTGLNDIAGHSAQGLIERAVALRLVDSRDGGLFQPDATVTRGELADYLVMGNSIRQFRPTDGSASLFDASGLVLAAAEAVTARGAALRDVQHLQAAVVAPAGPGAFEPDGTVMRAELAFNLVQALGLETQAEQVRENLEDEPITVAFKEDRVPLEDDEDVPAALRGHVQLALDLQLMNVRFSLEQGPFDPLPTIKAQFEPLDPVSRAGYAFSAVNYLDRFRQAP